MLNTEKKMFEPKLAQMKLDKLIDICKPLIQSIIKDSIIINNKLDEVVSTPYFDSMDNRLDRERIHVLKLKIEAYLKILQNIKLTYITLHFANKFINEIKKCTKEAHDLLENILITKKTSQNYSIDTNGRIIKNN